MEATLGKCSENVAVMRARLRHIAEEADALVSEMDFSLFYDPMRKALSVGYDVTQDQLQRSFYDLLASEARSAVFVAIAKNEIPQDAWLPWAVHIRAMQNVPCCFHGPARCLNT